MQPQRGAITLYTVPGCLACRRTRQFLIKHRVRFREVNVLTQPRVLLNFLNCYGKLLPVVVVDGKALSGINQRRLTTALGLQH